MATKVYIAISTTNRTGDSVAGGDGATYAATFATLTAALADPVYGKRNVAILDEQPIFEGFKDASPQILKITASGWEGTTEANTVIICAAATEKHTGIPNTGFKLKASGSWDLLFQGVSGVYFNLDDLELEGGLVNTAKLESKNKIQRCLILGKGPNSNWPTIYMNHGAEISCSLIYGGYYGIYARRTNNVVHGNVVVDCTVGISIHVDASATISHYNNVAYDNINSDFSGSSVGNHNASSDTSAPGSSNLHNIIGMDCFEDPAARDYHLKAGSPLNEVGYDLTGILDTDIDGQPWIAPYSIGYDQPGAFTVLLELDNIPNATKIRVIDRADNSELVAQAASSTTLVSLDMPYPGFPVDAHIVLLNEDYYYQILTVEIGPNGLTIPTALFRDRWRIVPTGNITRASSLPNLGSDGNLWIELNPVLLHLEAPPSSIDWQDLYSTIKSLWHSDDALSLYPFPLASVTDSQFELLDSADFANTDSKKALKNAGWAKLDSTGASEEEWLNATILTAFEDEANDQAKYKQAADGTINHALLPGAINQAIKIYGDSHHGNIDYRDHLTFYLKIYAKEFACYDLVAEQGLSALTYKKYALPLTNPLDPYSVATEAEAAVITGITINPADITLTEPHSAQELYDHSIWWTTQDVNIDEPKVINAHSQNNYSASRKLIISSPFIGGIEFTGNIELSAVCNLAEHHINGILTLTTAGTYTLTDCLIDTVINTSGESITLKTTGTTSINNVGADIIIDDAIYIDITNPNILPASSVRLYNETQGRELELLTGSPGTGYTHNSLMGSGQPVELGDIIRLDALKSDGVTHYHYLTEKAVATVSGITFTAVQTLWTDANLLGVDGSIQTEFIIDGTHIQFDINSPDNKFSMAAGLSWAIWASQSENGMRHFFGALSSNDPANWIINNDIVDVWFDNLRPHSVVQSDAIILMRQDKQYPVVPVTTGGGGISLIQSGLVFAAGTGLTLAQNAKLNSIPADVWGYSQ